MSTGKNNLDFEGQIAPDPLPNKGSEGQSVLQSGPETIHAPDEHPVPLTSRSDLIEHETPSKKDKPGIESLSITDVPIPSTQDVNFVQYENTEATDKDSSCKRGKPGIESISSKDVPIPFSQDVNFVQHENTKAIDKDSSCKKGKPGIGIESIDNTHTSPIPASQDANIVCHENHDAVVKAKLRQDELKHKVEDITRNLNHIPKFTEEWFKLKEQEISLRIKVDGSEEDLLVTDVVDKNVPDSHEESHPVTVEQAVSVGTNSCTNPIDSSLAESMPTVITAETAAISGSFSYSGGDILIPKATLVPEYDPSIPNAEIVEPEQNALTLFGKKINPKFVGLGIAAFLAAVISLAVVLTKQRNTGPTAYDTSPSEAPSSSLYPTSTPSVEPSINPTAIVYSDLVGIITERTGYNESVFSDVNSHRRMALEWLVDDFKSSQSSHRNVNSLYTDIEIFERFTMALLYFETIGDGWYDSYQFLTPDHVCKWRGKRDLQKKGVLNCTPDKRVTELVIFKNNLKGSIPPEIGLLTDLTVLNFGLNDISGSLPSLHNLINVTQIIINNNDFNGVMPDISMLTNLQTFDASYNDLVGNLFEAGNLTQLKALNVAGNLLSGEVPKSFQELNLETMQLQNTKLSGSIDFLCPSLPVDINLDCYGDVPQLQCNCCIGCTFAQIECDSSTEAVASIKINEADEYFKWEVYEVTERYPNFTQQLLAAGGLYDDGESVAFELCLPFPGDYAVRTVSNGTDMDGFFTVGDYSIHVSVYHWDEQWSEFSLDPEGFPFNVPSPYPTYVYPTLSPILSPYPTSSPMSFSPTPWATPTVGTNKTLSPTLAVSRPEMSEWDSTCLPLNIQLTTDAFGEETSYYIYKKDNDTVPVVSRTSFESNMTYLFTECLDPRGCYYFMIVDEFDDGICCDQGRGSYNLTLEGKLVGQGGKFTTSDTVMIGGSCGEDPEGVSCKEGHSLLNVTVKTDDYGHENHWSVSSKSSNQTIAVNLQSLSTEASSELSCIPEENCYDFLISDYYGDGWSSDDAYWMVQYGDEIVGQGGGQFNYTDGTSFGLDC